MEPAATGFETWQIIVFLIAVTIPILPNLWSIWHAYYRRFDNPNERMAWLGLCVFVPVVGGLLYIIFGRKRARGKLLPPGQTE